jgi:hypothetical protein
LRTKDDLRVGFCVCHAPYSLFANGECRGFFLDSQGHQDELADVITIGFYHVQSLTH